MRILAAIIFLSFTPACGVLRDSVRAARINQNIDQTDAWLNYYSNKASK
jgi:hypothetical protein